MNILLIFFAFPIAVIIISAILQKLLNSPVAVAALIFAIFLVLTFAVFDEIFLIATFAYTILAFITALITKLLCKSNDNDDDNNRICECLRDILNNCLRDRDNRDRNNIVNSLSDILSSNNSSDNNNNSSSCGCNSSSCGCNRHRRF